MAHANTANEHYAGVQSWSFRSGFIHSPLEGSLDTSKGNLNSCHHMVTTPSLRCTTHTGNITSEEDRGPQCFLFRDEQTEAWKMEVIYPRPEGY